MIRLLLVSALAASVYGQPLKVLVSNGLKGVMEELHGQAEKEVGHPLEFKFNSTAGIKQQIASGEAFDATLITVEAIDDLTRKGKLASASSLRADLGRSILGIGIKAGVPKPDIKTIDAFKKTLRATPSITYPKDGASRGYIESMFEKLGVMGDVKSKIILANGSGPATESVAEGKASLVITLFSEIVPVKGVEILGPLPGEYQSDIKFAAAASSTTKQADAARKLIAFVASPARSAIFKAKGLEHK